MRFKSPPSLQSNGSHLLVLIACSSTLLRVGISFHVDAGSGPLAARPGRLGVSGLLRDKPL